ncbi:MAG: endolytic transglycosylase MltG, partial [Anaerolineae bacterium]|nr:endolytic transglycosylase MltG [Anaerolineae bacterium]
MTHSQLPDVAPAVWWRRGVIPGLLLVGGAAAWAIVLIAVLGGARQDTPAGPDLPPPDRTTPLATLAAVVSVPTASPTPTDSPTVTPTPIPTLALTSAPTLTPAAEAVQVVESTPASDACAPPEGWERYTVQQDDTLFAFVLGAENTVTVDDLVAINCLNSRYLQVGQVLYLPPGAAENAPPSVASVASGGCGIRGPRPANCPCTITVAQGWRLEQIADAINAAQTMFTGGDFLAATGPGSSAPFGFVMERPPGTTMEGFMFPGPYTVQNDTTAEQFRDMLLAAFDANVPAQMRADAAAQGVTFYQALVIASIVQRETRGPETQKLVASVYYNHVRDGSRLGSTVTVQYAIGVPGNWWPRVRG